MSAKRTPALVVGLVSAWAAVSVGARPAEAAEGISYTISVSPERRQVVRVEASFLDATGELHMTDEGAEHLEDGWAGFVHGLVARRRDGRAVAVDKIGPRRWRLAEPGGPMTISYEVRLEHDPEGWPGGIDGAAFATDWGVFFTGRAVFVVPDGAGERIEVDFRAPPPWRVSTPWEAVDGRADAFRLQGETALTESIVFVGDHVGFTTERGGFELAFALGGESVIERQEEFRRLADGVFDFYVELMGGAPRAAPGERSARILVVINEGEETDGEVIGSHISMLLSTDPDPMGELFSRFGLAHELFHLWNGKSIRHQGSEDWFSEGFTNLYALKALHHIGELDEATWFLALDRVFYQRYRTDEGLGRMTMREAVAEKDARWGLIYGGGLFVALCQDVEIRLGSGDRSSVDDLMREMFGRYGGAAETYEAADVERLASRLSGRDQTGFWRRHILGVEPVPVAECLGRAGLQASIEDGHLRVRRPEGSGAEAGAIIDGILGR